MRTSFSAAAVSDAVCRRFACWRQRRAQQSGGEAPRHVAVLAAITGVVGPATARYVQDAVDEARERQAEVLILSSIRRAACSAARARSSNPFWPRPVPVIGYVAPGGAHAASAGTYILYATSIAAMAPGTNIGAATPVQIGGTPGLPSPSPPSRSRRRKRARAKPGPAKPAQAPLPTIEIKAANDAVALDP